MHRILPEYPSLSRSEVAEGAAKRLAKSRRKFIGQGSRYPAEEPWIIDAVGRAGAFDHASTSVIHEWLKGWRIPTRDPAILDVQTSLAVFVGVIESKGMPETSPLQGGAPFVTISSHFVEICSRIADLFPFFASLVARGPNVDQMNTARWLPAEYLDPEVSASREALELIRGHKDGLFTARTTAAAVRWAIAHEMAHAVASKAERREAYEQTAVLWSGLEEEQWFPKRHHLANFRESIERYRDEVACDLLANKYVLMSPFGVDDLVTQVSGALLALEAIKWDGWTQDGSAISQTHPSPALRFKLIWLSWLDTLQDPETWAGRDAPGPLGLQDFAHWRAYEKWISGAYRDGREGAAWDRDISETLDFLRMREIPVAADPVYVRDHNGAVQLVRPG